MDANALGSLRQTLPTATLNGPQSLEMKLNRLKELEDDFARFQASATMLADRLDGTHPEKEPPDGPSPVPNGLVDSLADVINRMGVKAQKLAVSLARIESRLG